MHNNKNPYLRTGMKCGFKCFFSTSLKVYIWVWICTETVMKRYSLQVSFFLRKIVHGDLNEAISANETDSLHGKFSLVGN